MSTFKHAPKIVRSFVIIAAGLSAHPASAAEQTAEQAAEQAAEYADERAVAEVLAGAPNLTVDLRGTSMPLYPVFTNPALAKWVYRVITDTLNGATVQNSALAQDARMRDPEFLIRYFGLGGSQRALPTPRYPQLEQHLWAFGAMDPRRERVGSYTADELTVLMFEPGHFNAATAKRQIVHELGIRLDAKFDGAAYFERRKMQVNPAGRRALATTEIAMTFQTLRALRFEADALGTAGKVADENVWAEDADECAKRAVALLEILWDQNIRPRPDWTARIRARERLREAARGEVRWGNDSRENFCVHMSRYELAIPEGSPPHGPRPRIGD